MSNEFIKKKKKKKDKHGFIQFNVNRSDFDQVFKTDDT